MKYFQVAAALASVTMALNSTPVFAADVGVSVSVGQPGFYGQIDIGDFPRPVLIYREPRLIEHGHRDYAPIYMRVPPGHAKHWDKHCHDYNACGRRVYFVQDDWYNREYVPRYQQRHQNWQKDIRGDEAHGHNQDKGHSQDKGQKTNQGHQKQNDPRDDKQDRGH